MPKKTAAADRHKADQSVRLTIRLPIAYAVPIRAMTAQSRRTITAEVQLALEDAFVKYGIKFQK